MPLFAAHIQYFYYTITNLANFAVIGASLTLVRPGATLRQPIIQILFKISIQIIFFEEYPKI